METGRWPQWKADFWKNKRQTPTNTNTPITTEFPRAKTSPIPVTNHKLVTMLGSCPFQRNGPKFPKFHRVRQTVLRLQQSHDTKNTQSKPTSTRSTHFVRSGRSGPFDALRLLRAFRHNGCSKATLPNHSKRMTCHVPFKPHRKKCWFDKERCREGTFPS